MKIHWDSQAMENLMSSNKISDIEQDIMMKKMNEIQAAFLQEFGFQGKFRIVFHATHTAYRSKTWHAGRVSWRVVADDAKTTAALKGKPKWLNKFTQ